MRRSGAECAHEHRRRHAARECGGYVRHEYRGCAARATRRDEHHRERIARQNRTAQRCDHALSGRRVPPLSLQEVHGRSSGLCAGSGHRILRRRSGQLRVSALRPLHLPLPRVRKRQGGEDRQLSSLQSDRSAGRRSDFCFWSSRRHKSIEHARASGVFPRLHLSVHSQYSSPP